MTTQHAPIHVRRFDRLRTALTVCSIGLNAVAWAVLLWKIPYTPDAVLLHYNIFFGVDATGSWYQLFAIPLSGLIIVLVNEGVLLRTSSPDLFVKRLMSILTLIMQLIVLVAAFLILLLNN